MHICVPEEAAGNGLQNMAIPESAIRIVPIKTYGRNLPALETVLSTIYAIRRPTIEPIMLAADCKVIYVPEPYH